MKKIGIPRSAARNIYSQHGEDGVLEALFAIIGPPAWYLDIGAHDGTYMSNTRRLREAGAFGLCVEADPLRAQKLVAHCAEFEGSEALFAWATVDNVCALWRYAQNQERKDRLSVLSIDTDAYDWHLWQRLITQYCRPAVAVLEVDPAWPRDYEHIYDPNLPNRQTSFASMVRTSDKLDYSLAFHTGLNCVFVDRRLGFEVTARPDALWIGGADQIAFYKEVDAR